MRFKNQFKAEIDSAGVAQISKYFLPQGAVVRPTVDSLLFMKEGLWRARNILKTNYGKESELVNVCVNNIVYLPLDHGANPNTILEYYQKLSPNVQVLETMGKIN